MIPWWYMELHHSRSRTVVFERNEPNSENARVTLDKPYRELWKICQRPSNLNKVKFLYFVQKMYLCLHFVSCAQIPQLYKVLEHFSKNPPPRNLSLFPKLKRVYKGNPYVGLTFSGCVLRIFNLDRSVYETSETNLKTRARKLFQVFLGTAEAYDVLPTMSA